MLANRFAFSRRFSWRPNNTDLGLVWEIEPAFSAAPSVTVVFAAFDN
jgi:hypothetical protein